MADTWDGFGSWDRVLPPNRPGTENVARIAQLIRPLPKASRIAVLGTTVEYLDLLYLLEFRNVICIEKHLSFRDSANRLRWSPVHETLIEGDWLDVLPKYPSTFDLVLSDLTLGNLSYEMQPEFTHRIAESLTLNGRIIDRILTYRKPSTPYTALYNHFIAGPTNLTSANNFNARWLFCGERVRDCLRVDSSATYDWTAQQYPHPAIGRLLSQCACLSPRGSVWHYGRDWGEVRKEYFRSLRQLAEFPEPRSSVYRDWVYLSVAERA
jgi:hypothetical protein